MLGAYSALELKRAGHTVTAVGRRMSDNGFFAQNGCRYIGGIVLESADTYKVLPTDIDAIVHMAGTMPAHADSSSMPYVQSIVVGIVRLLEWMRLETSCRRVVFNTTPSDIIHHFAEGKPVDDDASRSFPRDGGDHAVYAICKSAAVDILEHYRIAYGFRPCVFRHMMVYGWHPDAGYALNGYHGILPYRQVIRNCIAGKPIEIWGDPTRLREILYIDDFAAAVRRAAESDVCGMFNLPGDKPYTVDEQIRDCVSVFSPLGEKTPIAYRPDKPSGPTSCLSGEKAKRLLKWQPLCSWKEACRRMKREMAENRFRLLWGEADTADIIPRNQTVYP